MLPVMRSFALLPAALCLGLLHCSDPHGTGDGGGTTDGGGGTDATVSDTGSGNGDGGRSDGAPVEAAFVCPGDQGTSITGTVTTPNGEDPVPGAIVYVSRTMPAAFTPGVGCDACELPSDVIAWAQTDITGAFSIPHAYDAGGMGYLVVQRGRFRRVTPLTFGRCMPATPTATQLRLPGTRADGDIPRILVANNVLDDIGRVLTRIGITDFEMLDGCRPTTALTPTTAQSYNVTGTSCPLGSVLADATRLAQYNIVFVPCGALGFNYSYQVLGSAQNSRIPTNVATWMERGGRLYVSDTAYGLLERSFPEAISFATGNMDGRDPANVGAGGSSASPAVYAGHPQDDQLTVWLRGRNALAADGTVSLTGFISPWVAIDSVPPATKNWISADVQWFSGPMGSSTRVTMPNKPLTITANYLGTSGRGCGRAVYTSYHVDTRSVTMGAPLSPQERVLEWLLLELGACIAIPG